MVCLDTSSFIEVGKVFRSEMVYRRKYEAMEVLYENEKIHRTLAEQALVEQKKRLPMVAFVGFLIGALLL